MLNIFSLLIYITVFLSAFLLFWSELLFARIILPEFGGTPGVWTTSLSFYQIILVSGYSFVHFFSLKKKTLLTTFIFLFILSLISFALPPFTHLSENPIMSLFYYLSSQLLFPFFILTCTTPLLQKLLTEFSNNSHYSLYSLSNTGSFMGLLFFPFIFEPYLSLITQKFIWRTLFSLYGLFLIVILLLSLKNKNNLVFPHPGLIARKTKLSWFFYSFSGSVLLSSFSNKICQDISVIPFFWIIPLALYLFSWIHSFQFFRSKSLPLLTLIATGFLPVISVVLIFGVQMPFSYQLLIYCFTLYIFCLFCHYQLYSQRPTPRNSTIFYFWIGLGGCSGALLVGIIAPLFFTDFFEIHTGILLMAFALGKQLLASANFSLNQKKTVHIVLLFSVSLLTSVYLGQKYLQSETDSSLVYQSRNFFGVIRVVQENISLKNRNRKILFCGRIIHGLQFVDSSKSNSPSSYYSKNTAPGLLFQHFNEKNKRHIGVLGLGIGTLSCYGKANDTFTYYEINPQMIEIARNEFSYLKKSLSNNHIFLGDGRKVMETQNIEKFDILFLDAFRSDAVPVHLITEQAFKVYLSKIHSNGVIAVNISNKYLNFIPLMQTIARKFSLSIILIEGIEDEKNGIMGNNWIILSPDSLISKDPALTSVATPLNENFSEILWTDDYSSLYPLLK